MLHQEGFFEGVRKARICYQAWLPEGEPKASIVIVHGLAEHCGRYMNVVNHFVPRGYAVYGLDQIGHGKSEGRRVYVERFADYTTTLDTYFGLVRGWQPGRPVFLVGHSLGGLIGPVYLLDYQPGLAGAVISAPFTRVPDNISPLLISASKLLSIVAPKAGVAGIDADGVSKDPAVVRAYVADPLVYRGKTTARLGSELIIAQRRLTAEAARITLPILIVQGGADRLIDPNNAKMLYEGVSSPDKKLIVYEGLHHEVFNEPERDRVLGDVQAWLEAHLSG